MFFDIFYCFNRYFYEKNNLKFATCYMHDCIVIMAVYMIVCQPARRFYKTATHWPYDTYTNHFTCITQNLFNVLIFNIYPKFHIKISNSIRDIEVLKLLYLTLIIIIVTKIEMKIVATAFFTKSNKLLKFGAIRWQTFLNFYRSWHARTFEFVLRWLYQNRG